ncbi:hypothetical protein ABVD24_19280 [Xanthomonas euvesicatoria]
MMPKALRKRVNRKDKGYHALRRSEINDLDKAASFLLAISYSGRTSQTKVSQGLIQMDCVALEVINDEWLVAANSRRLDDWHMEELAQELGFDFTYAIVERGQGGMHAEMQVLEEIKASSYSAKGVHMGISKPCCFDCKTTLDTVQALYSHYHTDTVVNWEAPDLS